MFALDEKVIDYANEVIETQVWNFDNVCPNLDQMAYIEGMTTILEIITHGIEDAHVTEKAYNDWRHNAHKITDEQRKQIDKQGIFKHYHNPLDV